MFVKDKRREKGAKKLLVSIKDTNLVLFSLSALGHWHQNSINVSIQSRSLVEKKGHTKSFKM